LADKKILKEVEAYVEKYYIPDNDDIKLDKEMRTVFERITAFREKKAERKRVKEQTTENVNFDVASMRKKKITNGMSSTMSTNRNIEDLMAQMEETFTIALQLSLDEAKDLLASAGYALSRSSKMDIIVAYFLQNKIYDMFEINDVLYAYEQPIFE
jgi:hypothetical protein